VKDFETWKEKKKVKHAAQGSLSTSGGKVPNSAIKCCVSAGVRGFLPSEVALASILKSILFLSNQYLLLPQLVVPTELIKGFQV
jgi:hypothetical protein